MIPLFLIFLHNFWINNTKSIDIHINLEFGGFENDKTLIEDLISSLRHFMGEKYFDTISIQLTYNYNFLSKEFMNIFNQEIKKSNQTENGPILTIKPESILSNLFNSYHTNSIIKSRAKYSLFLINSEIYSDLSIFYGDSEMNDLCFALGTKSSFCYLSVNTKHSLPLLFRYITYFVENLIISKPLKSNLNIPTKLLLPIISFGPIINSISLRPYIDSILPTVENHILVNYKNLFDFPIIASGFYEKNLLNINSFIKKSEHVLGVSIVKSFEDNLTQKIIPLFIFEQEFNDLSSKIIYDDSMTSIFYNKKDDIIKLVLTALSNYLPGLNFDYQFSGHHPLYPNGGASDFSPLFTDLIIRNYIFNDLNYIKIKTFEIFNLINQINKLELNWINYSNINNNLIILSNNINEIIGLFNNNQYLKSLSKSIISKNLIDEIDLLINNLKEKSEIFSKCCPIIYFVDNDRNKKAFVLLGIGFILMLFWAIYKFYQLYNRKKFGVFPQVLEF